MEPGSEALDSVWLDLQAMSGIPFTISRDSYFTYLTVGPAELLSLLEVLKFNLGMNYLANVTSSDHGTEFEVVYHLYAIPDNGRKIVVRTHVPRDQGELATACQLYPTANWQEREIYDLMGILFQGHPHLARILLPDDFQGYPLRKDFKKEGQ